MPEIASPNSNPNRDGTNPRTKAYDYLNPEYVGLVLDQHYSVKANRRLLIWSLLSLECWLVNFLA
jgi:asparagine synthase (glutamine-hydrolysing)